MLARALRPSHISMALNHILKRQHPPVSINQMLYQQQTINEENTNIRADRTRGGMLHRQVEMSIRSRATPYKPQLLVQYDKHDVAFTAWLANVDKIMYAGKQVYVLQFNLHFMNGLSDRNRFRAAKFEVEAFSRNSSSEAPEMMFVRPASDPKLVQGMVLPPSMARWKICEPPEGGDGIPRHARLQAMVRSRGRFAIVVNDFQVKIGRKDWLRPDRTLQARHKGRSLSLLESGISVDTEDSNASTSDATSSQTSQSDPKTVPASPSLVESIPRKPVPQRANSNSRPQSRLSSVNPARPVSFALSEDPGSDQRPHTANDLTSTSPAWRDSIRTFDDQDMSKRQSYQAFTSAVYGERGAIQRAGPTASVISNRTARNGNNAEMNALVAELNSESDLLEAWLRRESLRKKAIETYLDRANWDTPTRTRQRTSTIDRHDPGPQRLRHHKTLNDLKQPRKTPTPKRIESISKKTKLDSQRAPVVPPPKQAKYCESFQGCSGRAVVKTG